MANKIKNVFVSHHHKDDTSVSGLTKMLGSKRYVLRNSSIRVNPDNEERLQKKQVSDRTIERLLRMKMKWASQVIVVIGKETHTRDWVNWEIQAAHKLGKPIIGVYENGLKDNVDLPEKLKDHATSIVGWRADSVISALNGESNFQYPDGTPFPNSNARTIKC